MGTADRSAALQTAEASLRNLVATIDLGRHLQRGLHQGSRQVGQRRPDTGQVKATDFYTNAYNPYAKS